MGIRYPESLDGSKAVQSCWLPTFLNARYTVARREFEATEGIVGNSDARTFEENVLLVVKAGQVVLVDMDHALDDEVGLEATSGYNRVRQVVIRSTSAGVQAVFSSDVIQ